MGGRVVNLTPRTARNAADAYLLDAATFPRRLNAVADVRAWATKTAQSSRLIWTGENLADLAVCASELATNAVRYGNKGDVFGVILIQRYRHALRVEVIDQGNTERLIPHIPAEPGTESGRGLVVVEALATSWGQRYDRTGGGIVVWCEIQNAEARPR